MNCVRCGRAVLVRFMMLGLVASWFHVSDCAHADESAVDYGRDIRPVLSDKCYFCHGPDAGHRDSGLRLDQKEGAFGEADSGEIPVVPGKLSESELYRRILSEDEDERMPPVDSHKELTEEEKRLIGEWIKQGAPWREHWAFEKPVQAELPRVKDAKWPRNEVDRFILARLDSEKLTPNPEADKETLIRRVTFDLTGLPPTSGEVVAFLADKSSGAYERVVDRLLKSPHYGEHMARFWLDAARYGDTHGMHLDNYREMWPYRDWVVQAMNRNLSFDQFTIEQLAGDLLENPTLGQLIATGFIRCHVTTNEEGSIVEEVYVRNVVDRVETVNTVFMGLTMGCTRCHDHKFDPMTMKDFYSFFAFFNSLDGNAMDGNKQSHLPVVEVPRAESREEHERLLAQIRDLYKGIRTRVAAFEYEEPTLTPEETLGQAKPVEIVWVEDDIPAGATTEGDWNWGGEPGPVYSGQRASTRTGEKMAQHSFLGAREPLYVADESDVLFAYVYLDPDNPPEQVMLQWNDGSWEHRAYWGENKVRFGKKGTATRRHIGKLPPTGEWVRLEVPVTAVDLSPGSRIEGMAFTQFGGTTHWDRAGIVSKQRNRRYGYRSLAAWIAEQRTMKKPPIPADLAAIVHRDKAKRSEDEQRRLRDYFIERVFADSASVFDPLHKKIDAIKSQVTQREQAGGSTLIFRERETPRKAYMLTRGDYDQRGEEIGRATPGFLIGMAEDAPKDRLGLAQWLVRPDHPLLARVTVNRFWQQVFGTGIVKTSEDFGSQGEVPSHPELLDWLACQFVADGWDVKKMMRRLVLSATYRQSSHMTPEAVRRDPANRLLARGPRFRLDAEMLRDQALAVSGLLLNELGGPSVKPPQPGGLWFAVAYTRSNTAHFKADSGADKVHRRTLYTFFKRTSPPPQLSTFDAPSREMCVVRRERTNTPLQALLLMNDPQFVDAARALAQRAVREGGDSVASRAAAMLRMATSRHPREEDVAELVRLYRDSESTFSKEPEAAHKLIASEAVKPEANGDAASLAAWTLVANLVLNLDEVINKN